MTISLKRTEWVEYIRKLVAGRARKFSWVTSLSSHDWKDIEQEAMIRVWRNKHFFRRAKGHIKSWIKVVVYRAVSNQIRNHFSAYSKLKTVNLVTYTDGLAETDWIDENTNHDAVRPDEIMPLLQPKHARELALSLQGYTKKQISSQLRTKRPTVYGHFREIKRIYNEINNQA